MNLLMYDSYIGSCQANEDPETFSYYLEQNFECQGFRDLYAYAAQHGPFMLCEIAEIADQLLTQVETFNNNRIVLKFLAP